MNQIQKSPTLEDLLQYQKQLNQQLISIQQKNPAYLHKQPIYLSSKQKINPWESIDTLLHQSRTELKELKSLPLKYRSANYEHSADKLRNEISRNKLRKYKLEMEKSKLLEEEGRESQNLDVMLEELEKIQREIQDEGMKCDQQHVDEQNGCNYEDSTKFTTVDQLFRDASTKFKEQYLEPLKNSHFSYQPVELFNRLASKVMETDRQISFLMSKKYEQQIAIQSHSQEYKNYQNKQNSLVTQIEQLKKQQQKYQNMLDKLQKQLKIVNNPNYINLELVQRIQLQQKIYEEECKGMYLNIMKLRKLIQLSGNIQAIKKAEDVMKDNNIVKLL